MFRWPCFRFLMNIAICLSCGSQLHIHWVPLRTSKNIQRKLFVLSGCSFLPKLSIFMPLILMQRDLLVVSGTQCNALFRCTIFSKQSEEDTVTTGKLFTCCGSINSKDNLLKNEREKKNERKTIKRNNCNNFPEVLECL